MSQAELCDESDYILPVAAHEILKKDEVMPEYGIQKFSDVIDLIPDDAWLKTIYEKNNHVLEDRYVLIVKGDCAIDSFDLDDVIFNDWFPKNLTQDGWILLVIVEGNLTVKEWIGNESVDGAVSLIVKGNMQAKNAVLGGQQVYVDGNLVVGEVFFGSGHNYGCLLVHGNTSIALSMVVNDYKLDLIGGHEFEQKLIGDERGMGDWELIDFETLSWLIEPSCIVEDPELENVILSGKLVLERLKRGQSILQQDTWKNGAVPPVELASDRSISIENIHRLCDPRRMPADAGDRVTSQFEFWIEDTCCRAAASGISAIMYAQRFVYLQNPSHGLLLTASLEELPRSFKERLMGKPVTGQWRMNYQGRRFSADGDEDWHAIPQKPRASASDTFPEEFHELLALGWNSLFDGIANYDHVNKHCCLEDLYRILDLVLVKPYDDWYDDERNGLWLGEFYVSFRQDGVVKDGEVKPALLCVGRTIRTEYIEDLDEVRNINERYLFSVINHADGSKGMIIQHDDDDSDDEAPLVTLNFSGGRNLEMARRIFKRICRDLEKANADLMENGIPPNYDDIFALEYWQENGIELQSSCDDCE